MTQIPENLHLITTPRYDSTSFLYLSIHFPIPSSCCKPILKVRAVSRYLFCIHLMESNYQNTYIERMEFYCDPCKIQLNSKSQWDQHLTGGKHMRAVAVSQPPTVDMSAASMNSTLIK